jgi:hypothetical protein
LTSVKIDTEKNEFYKKQGLMELDSTIYHLSRFDILDVHRPYLIQLHNKSIKILKKDVDLFLYYSIKAFNHFFIFLLFSFLISGEFKFKYDFLIYIFFLFYFTFLFFVNRFFIVKYLKMVIRTAKQSKIKILSFINFYFKLRYEK